MGVTRPDSTGPGFDETLAQDPALARTRAGEVPVPGPSPLPPPDSVSGAEVEVMRALVRRRLFSSRPDPVKIGRFTVRSRLGAGGMGVVWLAHDEELDRLVAVKLLRPDTAGKDPSLAAARLLREAQAMARLRNDNVVAVHEVGEHDGAVFLAMEYVRGTTLSEWLQSPHSRREIVAHMLAAGRGLAAAHDAGLVHRDFKPDNVLVGEDGRVCVTDFGLARVDAADDDGTDPDLGGHTRTATETLYGGAVGTPPYMARESLHGGGSPAADQFAFCITLYQALWGRHPFGISSPAAVAAIEAGRAPAQPPTGPRRIWRLVRRGLSHEPTQRHASMRHLLDALADDPGARWRRRGLIGLGALGVASALVFSRSEVACEDLDAPVRTVWNEARRATLIDAFTGLGASWMPTAATHAADGLDAWVEGWVGQVTEACEATHVRGLQSVDQLDRRTACLDQQRHRLEQLVAVLEHPDPGTAERAVDAVASLPDPRSCADVAVLERRLPRPTDPIALASLERAEVGLARGWAEFATGRFADARTTAEAALADADAADWRPAQAEAAHLLGKSLDELGEVEPARVALRRATAAALAGRDDPTLARAWLSLAYVSLWQADDASGASEHERLASAVVEAMGNPPAFRTDVLRLRAAISLAEGDLEKGKLATDLAHEALEAEGASEARMATGELALGLASFEAGEFAGARRHLQVAVDRFTAAKGADHPDTLRARNNLANVLSTVRDLDAAEREHEAVLAARERIFGPTHVDVASSLNGLAIVRYHRGDLEGALELQRRAYEGLAATAGPEASRTLAAAQNTVAILSALSRDAEARTLADTVLAAVERKMGPDHPNLIGPLQNLARVERALGERAPAQAHLARAIALAEATRGPDHPVMIDLLDERAWAHAEAGDVEAARADFSRVLALTEANFGADSPRCAKVLRELADISEPEAAAELRARADRLDPPEPAP